MPDDDANAPAWTARELENTFAEVAEAERRSRQRPNRVRQGKIGLPLRFMKLRKKQAVDELVNRGRLRLSQDADGVWWVATVPPEDHGFVSGSLLTGPMSDGRTGILARYIDAFNAALRRYRGNGNTSMAAPIVAIMIAVAAANVSCCLLCLLEGEEDFEHSLFDHLKSPKGGDQR